MMERNRPEERHGKRETERRKQIVKGVSEDEETKRDTEGGREEWRERERKGTGKGKRRHHFFCVQVTRDVSYTISRQGKTSNTLLILSVRPSVCLSVCQKVSLSLYWPL